MVSTDLSTLERLDKYRRHSQTIPNVWLEAAQPLTSETSHKHTLATFLQAIWRAKKIRARVKVIKEFMNNTNSQRELIERQYILEMRELQFHWFDLRRQGLYKEACEWAYLLETEEYSQRLRLLMNIRNQTKKVLTRLQSLIINQMDMQKEDIEIREQIELEEISERLVLNGLRRVHINEARQRQKVMDDQIHEYSMLRQLLLQGRNNMFMLPYVYRLVMRRDKRAHSVY
eukprot:NODE_6247_length_907_cov_44.335459_g5655_i0.p1 GENE.NODE_6247_length_907_cov_44.335459_g5655_i0~~NODE_6247_length_907_cov_44.335459_g5655_i0.p1  ORF type:complete len:230 (-),score=27.19 NODE_6247_length_907_cov_44.335459_g5655_i0:87-776(-)